MKKILIVFIVFICFSSVESAFTKPSNKDIMEPQLVGVAGSSTNTVKENPTVTSSSNLEQLNLEGIEKLFKSSTSLQQLIDRLLERQPRLYEDRGMTREQLATFFLNFLAMDSEQYFDPL